MNATKGIISLLTLLLLTGCSTWTNRSDATGSLFGPRVESAGGPFEGNSGGNSSPGWDPLPEMTASELERIGDVAFSRKDLADAWVQYDHSLNKDPGNTRVLYKKGLVLLAGKMHRQAVDLFESVIAAEPDHAPAHQGLGRALYQMGTFDKAETAFRKAVELDPESWKSHNYLGMTRDRLKKHKLAVNAYEAALKIRPQAGTVYNNLGVCLYLSGAYDQAVAAFEKAIRNGQTEKRVYNNLGMAQARTGDYEKAFDTFARAGGRSKGYNNLGCIYLAEGRYRNAAACFEKALGESPAYYVTAAANLQQAKNAGGPGLGNLGAKGGISK